MSTSVHTIETASTVNPMPQWPAILRAQLHAVGGAVRKEMIVAAILMLAVTLLMVVFHFREGASAHFRLMDMVWPAVALGLLAPMGVWKGAAPSQRTYLWAMPVRRSLHSLVKVFSGWAWLMGLVGLYLAWALAMTVLTGGHVVVSKEWGQVATSTLDLTFAGNPWMWLVPFAGATVTYLLGTIVALATDHPWRWFAATVFGYFLFVALSEVGEVGLESLLRAHHIVIFGRYGLLALFTGTAGWFDAAVEGVEPMPDPSAWAGATLLWTALTLAGVMLAATRFQER